MSDGKKTEELVCPGFDCTATVVVTVDQIAEGARVKCSNGHEFNLGGSAGGQGPASEDEWRRTSKKTIRLDEHGKQKKD